MSETVQTRVSGQSLVKGMLAGMVGGLIGAAAKTLAERIFPPRAYGEAEPPEEFSEQIAGHALAEETRHATGEGIHWAFGAVAGAAYGALVEFYPAATSKDGASFGLALGGLMHQGALPALGLSSEPEAQTLRERASEGGSHLVYGVTTETVRRFVRKIL